MSEETMFNLPFNDRQHFMQCRACEDWYDLRNIDDVILHIGHRGGQSDGFPSVTVAEQFATP